MAVISMASCKGGVGRTTLAICLADYFARKGLDVALIDADRKQHGREWRQRAPLDCAVDVIDCYDPSEIDAKITDIARKKHIVVIDHEKITSSSNTKLEFSKSDLIIIPVGTSHVERLSAIKLRIDLKELEKSVDRIFPTRILLNNALCTALDYANIAMNGLQSEHMLPFKQIVWSRSVYQEIFTTGNTPVTDRSDPDASSELEILAEEVRSVFARGPDERCYKPAWF